MVQADQARSPLVGFIGLGAMGAPMAARLASAGHGLMLLDMNRTRAVELAAELGAVAAETPAEVGAGCDTVVTMLPSSDIVNAVLAGETGLLSTLRPGSILVEMSSGVPARTCEFAERLAAQGVRLCDAPVSGGVPRAKTGELAIMVGGNDADIAAITPLLSAMGSSIMPTGPVGSAHAMKALNNLVSAGGFLIGIEALLIGSRYGLSAERMVDVLNASTGMNNSTQKKFKQYVLSRRFDAGFGLDLMVKDLGIALAVAAETGTTAPFASLCRDIWAGSQKLLGPGQDHTAVAKFSELLAGSTLEADQHQ